MLSKKNQSVKLSDCNFMTHCAAFETKSIFSLVSKELFGVIVLTKKLTKFFKDFLIASNYAGFLVKTMTSKCSFEFN